MKVFVQAARRLSVFLVVSLGGHLILLLGFDADRLLIPLRISSAPLVATLAGPGLQVAKERAATEAMRPSQLSHPKQSNRATRKTAKLVPAETGVLVGAASSVSRDLNNGGAESHSPGEGSASLPASLEGASIDAVRRYIFLLVPEARRFKRYPALARDHGWEGSVEVAISLSRKEGIAPAIALTRSSGFPALDEQALSMIGQAVQLVAVPELLRGKAVVVPLPIKFSLDD